MIGTSTRTIYRLFVAAILTIGFNVSAYAFDIVIDAAPSVLNLQSQGEVVTIHTDIAYWSVDVYSVHLNGVLISSWKADNHGNFVAKFGMDEIKTLDGLLIGDYNTLKLIGTAGDEAFVGETDIMVLDNIPKGKAAK